MKQILRGKKRTEAARFVAFRSHYLFEAEFRTPARGNEKGGVEQEQGRFRRRGWTPVPKFANLDELNQYLPEGAIRDRERHIEERPHSVGEAYQVEREKLKRRPAEDFDLSEYANCIVDSSGCVRVKYTRHSTPLRPGTKAEVRIDASHVEASCEGQVVARHERCYQPRREALALEHYLGVEHQQAALKMMLNFDSFIFELDSACDPTHKFTQEFRAGVLGQSTPRHNFSKLLSESGLSMKWYETLCRTVRNPLVHDTAPWPVLDVTNSDCSDYEFVLLKTNKVEPEANDCIRLSELAELYSGYKDALNQLHTVLLNEIATAGQSNA